MSQTTSTEAVPTLTAPGSPADAAIALRGVAKDYVASGRTVTAVAEVDLDIERGEFFSLLGPSGCGKTTTLRMIAGFIEPTRGQILLHGADVTGVPPNRRDVNLVFQNYALFPHMDVAKNIAFGLERKGVEKSEVRRRVGESIELVELTGREHHKPKELSGGQQQRVALARALVNRPRALLLDEPLGALDLKLRQSMQLELKRIQREVGITFVYVTHDQGEALTMSDRLVVMNNGLIEQLGTPREIYEAPATSFVAGFIGTSNLISATCERTVDGMAVLACDPDDVLLAPAATHALPGASIEMTVRPEKITISAAPPDGWCRVRGRVREIVYQGTSTSYTVVPMGGGEPLVVFVQNASDAEDVAAAGSQVWLTWSPQFGRILGSAAA
jgi:spermidine/putrescine transport system ATP-binding protein